MNIKNKKLTAKDNLKQTVEDIRFLIATNCCDETIQKRIENFINSTK